MTIPMNHMRFLAMAVVFGFTAAQAFVSGPKTTAHWKFNTEFLTGKGFRNLAPNANPDLPFLPWKAPVVLKESDGKQGVFCSRKEYGQLPYHLDLTAGNSEKVISYGARIRLDTIRKDYSSFVAGFYNSHRFMVDTGGGFHLGIQNVGVKRPQQWLRTDSEKNQPLVEVKKWHEVVFTIDATDPNRVLGYFFLDGKQQRNPHFQVNDDGVLSTNMDPFQVCKDPSDPGPPWYGSPLHGLMAELIIEKGYLIDPTLPHTGPLNNRVNLGIPSMDAKPGDTIKIPVILTNYSERSLSSIQFNLGYKETFAELLSVEKVGLANEWTLSWNPRGGGKADIALGGAQSPLFYSEGAVLKLVFHVKESTSKGSQTNLTLDDAKVDENRQLEVSTSSGKLYVRDPVRYGDVDGDGDVDLEDASIVLQYVVGLKTLPDLKLPSFTLKIVDVSRNGEITSYDAALILQYAAGLLSDFPALKTAAPKASAASFSKPGPDIQLTIPDPEPDASAPGVYLYRITGQGLEALHSAEFTFTIDPAIVTGIDDMRNLLPKSRLQAVNPQKGTLAVHAASWIATDKFQDFSKGLFLLRARQSKPGNGITIHSAYLNEGRLTGNFKSATVRSAAVGNFSEKVLNPSPKVRVLQGFIEVQGSDKTSMKVRIHDLSGRLVLARKLSTTKGANQKISLDGLPRGALIYDVSHSTGHLRGTLFRLH